MLNKQASLKNHDVDDSQINSSHTYKCLRSPLYKMLAAAWHNVAVEQY